MDLLGTILDEHLCCPVMTYVRAADALAAMEQLNVGIIVTDYWMPDINGVEFLRRAEQLKPGVPAIMITGHADALMAEDHAKLTNLKEILAKPFGVQVLADSIHRHWPSPASD